MIDFIFGISCVVMVLMVAIGAIIINIFDKKKDKKKEKKNKDLEKSMD